MLINDTIAAISTPHGNGGIGIIRISGDKAFEIAEQIFVGKKPFSDIKPNTISFGRIIDPLNAETIDEVLVSKMKAPHTFTMEDVIEINCHGGLIVIKRILELILKSGARLAEPGEFTKRAFLNGRIDLSQAEAVIDVINSKTEESSRAAVSQLEGKLSSKLKIVRDKLLDLITHIEVTVDYPEHDIEEITGREVHDSIRDIKKSLYDLTEGFDKGRILREGLNAVIVGRPNVGKSSLLNFIAGKNRAIVTDIPGTTRDIIEEYVNIGGIPVRLIDTAGIRETEDLIEQIGVKRAHSELENADLVILMIDADQGVTDEDIGLIEKAGTKKSIIIINKTDLVSENELGKIESLIGSNTIVRMSVKNGTGLESLEDRLKGLFVKGDIRQNEEVLLTNIRHKNLIDNAISSIDAAISAFEAGLPLDCVTIDIRNAAEYLGQITGESVTEDVMHRIFSRFCIGK